MPSVSTYQIKKVYGANIMGTGVTVSGSTTSFSNGANSLDITSSTFLTVVGMDSSGNSVGVASKVYVPYYNTCF
jgi:hypothetical protein